MATVRFCSPCVGQHFIQPLLDALLHLRRNDLNFLASLTLSFDSIIISMNRKSPSGTSNPFDWPLGRKVPIRPKNPCALHTTHLCERLFKQKSDFDITDPNGYRLTSFPYNCLHDPNLKAYMNRKDVHSLLITHGFITEDDKVICSAKEFNRYKDYLADVQLDWDQKFKMEQKKIVRAFLVLQDQGKIPAETTVDDLVERLLQRENIFTQQQGAPGGRVPSHVWREKDYLVLKLPKIKKINTLSSSFCDDDMAWKMKERKMLEEVVKEVQRELRLERQRKDDAIKLFNQSLTSTGSTFSTSLQRRPSLQKHRPLHKTNVVWPCENVPATGEFAQTTVTHTIYPVKTSEDAATVWPQISPTSSHEKCYKHQLDAVVEKLVDEILSHYFPLSFHEIK